MVKKAPKAIQLDKVSRAAARLPKGSLKYQQVSQRVLSRYVTAFANVCSFWIMMGLRPSESLEFDNAASAYVEHLYAEGDPYSKATDSLASIQYHLPAAVGRVKQAWKLCLIWRKVEPPTRVKPFTPIMALAIAATALARGFYGLGALIFVGFDAMLRTGELSISLQVTFLLEMGRQ